MHYDDLRERDEEKRKVAKEQEPICKETPSEYWLITYSWRRNNGGDIMTNCVHEGRLSEWMHMALLQPERWTLISAHLISKDEYTSLVGKL